MNAWRDRESWLGAIESAEADLIRLYRQHGNAAFNESNAKRIRETEQRLGRIHEIIDELEADDAAQ